MHLTLHETLPYAASRERFRSQARESGWQVATFAPPTAGSAATDANALRGLSATGSGFPVEVAWRGPSDAPRSLMVTAGLHGVEGFFGSNLLLDWFRATGAATAVPGANDLRMVAVHCLNPFGYANRRRANEQNIDLNRNFLLSHEPYDDAPAFDAELDALLHPREVPGRTDLFRLRLALMAARRGPKRVLQSIAGGQASNPRGLFFGGLRPSPFVAWCEAHWHAIIGSAGHITHFDLHSGLGSSGTLKLLLQPGIDEAGIEAMRSQFGTAAVVPPPKEIPKEAPKEGAGAVPKQKGATASEMPYQARGTWGRWLQHRFKDRRYEYACAEFGTYGPFRVLAALRAENIAWHHFGAGSPEHEQAANRLRDAFYPPSTRWRVTVRAKFLSLMSAAVQTIT